uniref:hypothetical protein n=1 Tax=Amycolatopsis sp. CA-082387 TaxID=3239918 RepID=UPI003F491492
MVSSHVWLVGRPIGGSRRGTPQGLARTIAVDGQDSAHRKSGCAGLAQPVTQLPETPFEQQKHDHRHPAAVFVSHLRAHATHA